jgi:hypothetical protein
MLSKPPRRPTAHVLDESRDHALVVRLDVANQHTRHGSRFLACVLPAFAQMRTGHLCRAVRAAGLGDA